VAVSGVFLYIVPLMLVILAFGLSIEERPLRTGSSMGSTGTASSEPTGTEPASGD
jgi:hypothetical protein